MKFYEFLVVGVMLSSGSYSSAIMAGLHPIKSPNLNPEDIEELEKQRSGTIYLI